MSPTVVSNSTPIIALAKIGRIGILQELFSEIIIPTAVFEETQDTSKKRPGSMEVLQLDWIRTLTVANRTVVEFLLMSVDPGEAEAIALAKELKADLVLMDDRAGRRIADSVGLAVTGTIGLLLRYYRGNPKAFKQALDELVSQGFRIGKSEYQKMLQLARH